MRPILIVAVLAGGPAFATAAPALAPAREALEELSAIRRDASAEEFSAKAESSMAKIVGSPAVKTDGAAVGVVAASREGRDAPRPEELERFRRPLGGYVPTPVLPDASDPRREAVMLGVFSGLAGAILGIGVSFIGVVGAAPWDFVALNALRFASVAGGVLGAFSFARGWVDAQ